MRCYECKAKNGDVCILQISFRQGEECVLKSKWFWEGGTYGICKTLKADCATCKVFLKKYSSPVGYFKQRGFILLDETNDAEVRSRKPPEARIIAVGEIVFKKKDEGE